MAMVEDAQTRSSGDGSFDAFFHCELPRLTALAAVLCGNRETGHDIAQEALMRTYSDWDRVAQLESPGGWSRRVVVNLARDHGRHRAVQRRRLPELAHQANLSPSAPDVPHDREFWVAVATLPDRQRTAVALFYIGDHSVSQVAHEMGIRVGSVKTMLHQARENLRHLLSEDT